MKNSGKAGIDISYLVDNVVDENTVADGILDDVNTQTADADADHIEQSREALLMRFAFDHDHFGFDITQDGMRRWVVDTIAAIDAEKQQYMPGFDITTVSPETLTPLLQKLRAQYETATIEADAARRDDIYQAYMTAFAGRPVAEIFPALAANDQIPATIQLKTAAYAQTLSPDVVKSKADREVIVAKINQYSLVSAPAPYWFVLSEVLNDEALSEKTHKAIAKEFSLDPHSVNGAALISALNSVNDDDQLAYSSENKLNLGDGLEAYANDEAQSVIAIDTTDGTFEIVLDPDENLTDLGLKLSLLKIWAASDGDLFVGEDIGPQGSFLRGANRNDLDRMQQIVEAMLGGASRYDGEILTEDLIQTIVNLNDFVTNGHHADELNIFAGDTNEAVNLERLAAVSLYLQNQADPTHVDIAVMQDHLALICSSQNDSIGENTGDDNAIETNNTDDDSAPKDAA